jgi:hypothetical protein
MISDDAVNVLIGIREELAAIKMIMATRAIGDPSILHDCDKAELIAGCIYDYIHRNDPEKST